MVEPKEINFMLVKIPELIRKIRDDDDTYDVNEWL